MSSLETLLRKIKSGSTICHKTLFEALNTYESSLVQGNQDSYDSRITSAFQNSSIILAFSSLCLQDRNSPDLSSLESLCQRTLSEKAQNYCLLLQNLIAIPSLNSTQTLDLSDVSIVLGDHWIQNKTLNGASLEGTDQKITLQFAVNVLKSLSSTPERVTEISSAKRALRQALTSLYLIRLPTSLYQQRVIATAFSLYLRLMTEKEPFLSALCWTAPDDAGLNPDSGHAMLFQVIKSIEETVHFEIYNSGDGIENHLSQTLDHVTRYSPFLRYENVPIERLVNYSLFEGVINLSHYNPIQPLDNVDATDIYMVLMAPFKAYKVERQPNRFIKEQNLVPVASPLSLLSLHRISQNRLIWK